MPVQAANTQARATAKTQLGVLFQPEGIGQLRLKNRIALHDSFFAARRC
ncbi:MAG TPA: hypothetical protein VL003_10520 [Pusillimonas sp.]|nr:hypothetical protein [Pusillimonas sp.]HUH88464.1 hypothetical protein [Pusillimonas sp.]